MKDQLFRIRWYNAQTGKYGEGTQGLSWEEVQEWIYSQNRVHPDMHHWWMLA